MDDVGDTGFVLVLNHHHLVEQCYRLYGIAKIEAKRDGCLQKLAGNHSSVGSSFLVLQIAGFMKFGELDIRLVGAGSNASYSFLLAISGLHGLHVLGGVVALVVIAIRALSTTNRNYSTIPLEITATYWHFVDILWIYLFIFFNWMK